MTAAVTVEHFGHSARFTTTDPAARALITELVPPRFRVYDGERRAVRVFGSKVRGLVEALHDAGFVVDEVRT